MASKREIKAVRRVLYDRARLREIYGELISIDVLMNTNPDRPIPPDDIRVSAGAGPAWYTSSGELDPGVLEAARRSKRIAQLLRETRRELNDVDFNPDDKRALRDALEEHAIALVKRADAWSDPQPGHAAGVAAEIHRHDVKALRGYEKVRRYLEEDPLKAFA